MPLFTSKALILKFLPLEFWLSDHNWIGDSDDVRLIINAFEMGKVLKSIWLIWKTLKIL